MPDGRDHQVEAFRDGGNDRRAARRDRSARRSRPSLETLLTIGLNGLAILVSILVACVLLLTAHGQMRRDLHERVVAQIATAAAAMGAATHAALLEVEEGGGPASEQVQGVLQRIRASDPGIRGICTMSLTDDERLVVVTEGGSSADSREACGRFRAEARDLLVDGESNSASSLVTPRFYRDEGRYWISGCGPIRDAKGGIEAILVVEMSASRIRERERSFLLATVVVVLALVPFELLLARLLAQRLVKPVTELAVRLEEVDETAPVCIVAPEGPREVVELANRFSALLDRLSRSMLQLRVEVEERHRAEASLARHREDLESLVAERTAELQNANMRLAAEVGQRADAQAALRRREAILQAVARVAEWFLGADVWGDRMDDALRILGTATGVSRTYVFAASRDDEGNLLVSQKYEWVAGGVTPQMGNPDLAGIPMRAGGFGRWEDLLLRGKAVYGLIESFPESEQAVLAPQEILSLAAVPVMVDEALWGFIGFDDCSRARVWSAEEIDVLRTASVILAAAIHRGQAREALDRLFTLSMDLMCVTDLSGRFLSLNPAWSHTLGYSDEELRERPFLDFVHPEDRAATAEAFREVGRGASILNFEHRYVCKGGSVKWFAINSTACAEEGQVYGVARDVSRQREIDRMKADFISSVSHELRTPLTSIKGFTATMLEDVSMPEEIRTKFLGVVSQESDRLMALIENLLQVSNAKKRALTLDFQPLDVGEVLNASADSLRPQMEARRLRFGLEIADELPVLHGSLPHLKTIVANLLSNAVKFTPEQGAVTMRAFTEPSRRTVHIEVCDNGLGIPAEDLARVFDRFYRVPRPGMEIPGTGLGLSITRDLVEAHGGRVKAASGGPNQGACFTVSLPVEGNAASASGAKTAGT